MKIAPAAAGLVPAAMTPAHAREMAARLSLLKAPESLKAEVSSDAAKARSSPLFDGQETRKGQAKAKLQQIREWVKIVRKLHAQNPQGMAKALAQAFKDLKAAVQAYRDAGGEEMAAAGTASAPVIAGSGPAPTSSTAIDETDEADEAHAARKPGAEEPEEQVGAGDADEDAGLDPDARREAAPEPLGIASVGRALYDAVVGEVRKMIGEDGLDFLRQVRALVKDMADLLQTARGQAAIRKQDKAADAAFEEADKALKALNQNMDGMQQDIRIAAPQAGMTLSVAA